MTGDQLVPLAAILAGAVAINLAAAWLLRRRNRDPAELFGSVATRPSDGENGETAGNGPEPASGAGVETDPAEGAGNRHDPPPLGVDGETVVCRHCGAKNRAGYQYCRWCVQSGFVDEDAGVTAGTAMTGRSL